MKLYTGSGNTITIEAESNAVTLKAPWDTVIHRGWVSGAKENTLPAFYLAKENGYDWAECDVRFTVDNVPVLAHDATITSEDSATVLTVAECTVEQLQSITLQTHETYGAIIMPTLAELLEMARLIGLHILIDVKAGVGTETNMHNLAKTVLASGISDRVVYMPQTSATAAAQIASIDKNASFDFVMNPTTETDFAPYQALLTGANTVAFDMSPHNTDAEGGVDMDVVNAIRAAGLYVCFWNVRASAYISPMDVGPLRITKQNTADKTNLDALYFAQKSYP